MPRKRTKPSSPEAPSGGSQPVDAEVMTEEEVAEEESAPEETPRAPSRKRGGVRARRRPGADVEVTARGSASDVSDAIKRLSPPPEEAASPEEDEELAALLSNPKNLAVVTRIFPRRWRGRKCDVRVERYRCPISRDDIEEDIFDRHGGKRYLVSVHPNTPTWETKTFGSFVIENENADDPVIEGDPIASPDVDEDPFGEEVEDPAVLADHMLNERLKRQIKIQKLRDAQNTLKILHGEDEENGSRGRRRREESSEADSRIQALEDRLGLSQVQSSFNERMGRIENAIENLVKTGAHREEPREDKMMPMLLQMMKSSDSRFETMMTSFMGMMNGKQQKEESMETLLDKLSKLKGVFGKDDSRIQKLEDRLISMTLERMDNPPDTAEDSDVKFAVKQAVPLAREFISKHLSKDAPPQVDKGEYQKAVRTEALRIATNMAKDWEKKGYLVKPPQGLPAPASKEKVGAPAEKKPREQAPSAHQEQEPEVEETEVELPPSPQSPQYDRKKAVDFVLDSLLVEMDALEVDGYVVGDALDRLDDELLVGVSKITTGEELEQLVGPYADPEKISQIKERGKTPEVKSWLTRVITTIADEYRRQLKHAEGQAQS